MKKSKLTLGRGINNADYPIVKYERINGKKRELWYCPFYRVWRNMLIRCYSDSFLKKQPTYKGCIVCDEWLTFSNFKNWMEKQDWEGKQLDKDLLFEGNKIYSPETCIFVESKINKFTTDHRAARGEYPIGVCWYAHINKFSARCGNPFTGKQEHLGVFDNPLDAHHLWKKRKHEIACRLAEICDDVRLSEVLRTKYL